MATATAIEATAIPGEESEEQRFNPLDYQGLVRTIAREHLGRGIPLDDLIQEAQLGLLHACQRSDRSREATFLGYAAWCIKGYIRMALRSQSRPVRIPQFTLALISKIRKNKRDPGRLKRKQAKCVDAALRVMGATTTSDELVLEHLTGRVDDCIERLETADEVEKVIRLAMSLDPAHRETVHLWMEAVLTDKEVSQRQMAAMLGVTHQRVSQRLKEAFAMIRQEYEETAS